MTTTLFVSNVMDTVVQTCGHLTPTQFIDVQAMVTDAFGKRSYRLGPSRIFMDDIELGMDIWMRESGIAYPDRYEIARIISHEYYKFEKIESKALSVKDLYSYTNYMDLEKITEMYEGHFHQLSWQDRAKIEGRYLVYYLFYMCNYTEKMMWAILNTDHSSTLRSKWLTTFWERLAEKRRMMEMFMERGYIKNCLYWPEEKMEEEMNEEDDEAEETVSKNWVSIYDLFVYAVEFMKNDLTANFFYQILCAKAGPTGFPADFYKAQPWVPAIYMIDTSGYDNEEVVAFHFRFCGKAQHSTFYRHCLLYYVNHWMIFRDSTTNWPMDVRRILNDPDQPQPQPQFPFQTTEEIYRSLVDPVRNPTQMIYYENTVPVEEIHYMLNEMHYGEIPEVKEIFFRRIIADLRHSVESHQITETLMSNYITMFLRFPIKNARLVRYNTDAPNTYTIFQIKERVINEEDDVDENGNPVNREIPGTLLTRFRKMAGEEIMLEMYELNRKSVPAHIADRYNATTMTTQELANLIITSIAPSPEREYIWGWLRYFLGEQAPGCDRAIVEACSHEKECMVCLEEHQIDDPEHLSKTTVCMGCKKVFHKECMKKFIEGTTVNPKCPNCRRAFYSVFLMNRDIKIDLYEKVLAAST